MTVFVTAAFGFVGYILMRLSLDPSPLMLGFILGPMLEENFRRAMLLSRGSFQVFVTRPISATLLALVIALTLLGVVSALRASRRNGLVEEQPVATG